MKIIRLIGVLAFLMLAAYGQSPASKLTAEQWQEDVRVLMSAFERQHPNAYRRTKKEVIDAAGRELIAGIPAMSEDEILAGIMRIAAMVQDGHTNAFPPGLFDKPVFPLRMYLFDDGLYVVSAPKEYSDAVGAKVVEIGGVDAAEALKRVMAIVPADNEMGRRDNAMTALALPQVLAGLKINADKTRLKVKVDAARSQKTVDVAAAGSVHQLFNAPKDWVDAAQPGVTRPLYLRNPADPYWFEYDKANRIVYVQQNQIQNRVLGETVAQFYKRVLDLVAANSVDKFVLDLRNNGGGNNGLNRPVVIDIIRSKINEPGHLFVITGRKTFSAAQNLVSELEKYTNAIFVGEPTAGHPNHYGDSRPVELPNSKLRANISTLYWQDVDPRDTRPWTAPEIATPLTFADYRRGADPAMDAIIGYKPGSGLASIIASARHGKDIAAFTRELEKFVADPTHKYLDTEATVNRFGYDLLGDKRAADAVEVFKLNAKLHPSSANVYDSLGDGYQAVGSKDDAIKAYEKALSIDPNYASSRGALQKLRGQP